MAYYTRQRCYLPCLVKKSSEIFVTALFVSNSLSVKIVASKQSGNPFCTTAAEIVTLSSLRLV